MPGQVAFPIQAPATPTAVDRVSPDRLRACADRREPVALTAVRFPLLFAALRFPLLFAAVRFPLLFAAVRFPLLFAALRFPLLFAALTGCSGHGRGCSGRGRGGSGHGLAPYGPRCPTQSLGL